MEQGGGIMFWVLRRRHLLLVLLALAAAALALLFFRRGGETPSYRAAGAPAGRQAAVTLVIDPGHGGEDGGAVAADGTVESLLNLEVALRLREAGFPLPQGLWRMEDVEQAILAALKGGTQA